MTERMLKFVDLAQKTPELRAAEKRRGDFDEIYQGFDDAAAAGLLPVR